MTRVLQVFMIKKRSGSPAKVDASAVVCSRLRQSDISRLDLQGEMINPSDNALVIVCL